MSEGGRITFTSHEPRFSGKMERKRLNASTIRSAGYDAGRQLLEIEFSSGSIVQYSGVSPEVHRRFINSPSPGSFYQDQIEETFSGKRIR